MRARASIIGQLLVVFAVCAGLIGIAAVFGYAGMTRQDATAKQLTVQDYLLQHEAGLMQVEFDVAQAAVNGYALSGRKSGLLPLRGDRKSTRLNSSHQIISYAVFCLKKKTNTDTRRTT